MDSQVEEDLLTHKQIHLEEMLEQIQVVEEAVVHIII
jgi:hypothetical protein